MCIQFLDKTKLSQESKDIIVHAIKDHSSGNEINSPVGAALVFADKIDISKNRVLELGKQDRWHSNWLNINKTDLIIEDRKIIINYLVNSNFSKQILLEEWKKGIIIPIKASSYFGCKCIFQLNGNIIDLA